MNSPKSKLYLVIVSIMYCFVIQVGHAQNLIPNPSFEKTNAAVKKLKHEMMNFGIMSNWKSLVSSPDAHHPFVSEVKFDHKAPNFLKQFGQQDPRTGEGKIGMYIGGGAFKEGIITQLKQPLKAGKFYYFHMYVSLGEGISNSCTSSIGAYFTARFPKITETSKIPLHIESSEIICDTQEWVKVCGVYKAKGTEKYVSLGYFADEPKGKKIKSGAAGVEDAYYFVDDVELLEMRGNLSSVVLGDVCDMTLDFKDIEYLEGESEVYEEIEKALEFYIQYIQVFKVNKVTIVGHADDAGIDFENEIMSAMRAANVRDYMIEKGIDESLLEVQGVANTIPLDELDTELDGNTRVQIIVE